MTRPQRQLIIELPIGVTDEHNQVHRRAEIRKMRGHEEAFLYDDALSLAQLVTKLIHSCLLQLGNLEVINESTVADMYTADRNYLLVEIRRFTLGSYLQSSYGCPECGRPVSITEDLSQLPVRRLDNGRKLSDIEVHLEDGYVDRQGSLHTDIVLTLPKGVDEEFVASTAAKDSFKAQDALLLRCIERFGELPKATLEAYGVKILRDLTLGDRQRLQRAITAQSPGVNFERTVQCGSCGITFQAALDTSFFFSFS